MNEKKINRDEKKIHRDKGKVRQEAKQILDKFAKALEKVDSANLSFYVNRVEFEREEGEGGESDPDFKKRVLENAPNSDNDFVIAEKGEWK